MKNLLGLLSTKLELSASLPVFKWEAENEGYTECAAAFDELAEAEQRSCAVVLEQLRTLLERRAAGHGGTP